MTILVDEARWPWRGRWWAHLVSDASYEELHAFAATLGIPRRAFQGDHYDVPTELRARALAQGAVATDSRDLVRRLRAAGLRSRPTATRRGTRASVMGSHRSGPAGATPPPPAG